MTVKVKHSARTTGGDGRDADQADAATTAAPATRNERCIGDPPSGVGRSLTPEARTVPTPIASRLAVLWPQLERYLRRALRARGVARTDADDVLQEVALRALERSPCQNGTDDELLGWAYVVAVNKDIDRRRRTSVEGRRAVSDTEEATALDCREVETAVEARLALDAVWRELASFAPADRDAVLAGLTPYQQRPGADPRDEAVRRHRGRARLRKAIRRAVGAALPLTHLRHRARVATPEASLAAYMLAQVAVGVLTGVVAAATHHPAAPGTMPPVPTAYIVPAAISAPPPVVRAAAVRNGRPAPSASHSRGMARPRKPTSSPQPTRLGSVQGPAGTRADLDRTPDPGDGRLLCVKNVPNHGDELCLYQPPPQTAPSEDLDGGQFRGTNV